MNKSRTYSFPIKCNSVYLFYFFREFQPMAFASDNGSLLSDQDTNQFLV